MTVLVLQELFAVLVSPVAWATEHVPPLFGFWSVPVAVGVTGMVTTAELPLLIVSPLPPAVQVSTWVPLSIEHVSALPALSVGEPYVAPVVGNWSDRAVTRFGRRRPFLLVGSVLSGVGLCAVLNPPAASPVVLFACLAVVSIGYSSFNIPYLAMTAEMTDSPAERTSLMTWRIACVGIGTTITTALLPVIAKSGGAAASVSVRWAALLPTRCGIADHRVIASPKGDEPLPYVGDGTLINSPGYDGLSCVQVDCIVGGIPWDVVDRVDVRFAYAGTDLPSATERITLTATDTANKRWFTYTGGNTSREYEYRLSYGLKGGHTVVLDPVRDTTNRLTIDGPFSDRIDIDFAFTNKTDFAADEPVSLDLHVKNVQNLIVKVFEINTAAFYRAHQREVDTDLNLDGLVPNAEQSHAYAEPPPYLTAVDSVEIAAAVAALHDAPETRAALGEKGRRPQCRAGPHRFGLDLGVEVEGGVGVLGQPEVDGVAEVVAGEAELEADRPLPALPRPHRRTETALPGQCGDSAVAGRVGE